MKIIKCLIYILFIAGLNEVTAQEHLAPLRSNEALRHTRPQIKNALAKTTALTLPFFEDFTGYGPYPDSTKWVDNEVYINNTMCVSPISRGVATFDALNSIGIPYDSFSNYNFRFADSLTSQVIDLSTYTPADSLYLSFFYQPGGNGFSPTPADSFMLLLHKNNNDWEVVWSAPGSSLLPFQQVMVPITDSNVFFSGFQFRFVNIAALNYSDAVWNIDYIRLNSGRNVYDTAVNDVAFTANPTYLLNDYTYMPYRQFMANPGGERAGSFSDSLRNNYTTPQPITYGYTATELTTNIPLYTSPVSSTVGAPQQTQQLSYNTYINTIPLTGLYNKVVFENKYFIGPVNATDPRPNDTIVCDQVFDNYLAYDDGSAELSYYLDLSQNYPGSLAVEYHLNRPDTLRGVAIYFGRQAPPPAYKQFSILVYSSLAGVNANYVDHKLYEQDYLTPAYSDTLGGFWTYSLDTPVVLSAGVFYLSTRQPAYSDTLYFGFDANRVGGNHAYFNVLGQWASSQYSGAIMMRPLLGQPVWSSAVQNVLTGATPEWSIFPNPAQNNIKLRFANNTYAAYVITDIAGRTVKQGISANDSTIDITTLSPGMYFVRIAINGVLGVPKKLVKD